MTLRRAIACCLTVAASLFAAFASSSARADAMGIALEGFPYPYPVHFMPLTLKGEDLRLAYMDAPRRVRRTGGQSSSCTAEIFLRAIGRRPSRRWPRRAIGSSPRTKSASANRPSPVSPIVSTRWRAPRSRCSIVFTSTASTWSAIRWAGCWRSGWPAPMARASTVSSSIRRLASRTIDSMFRR